MAINSNSKGKVGEREFANILSRRGFSARRGQQFCGGTDSPDVVCESLSEYHFEVKRTERLKLYDALDQAEEDSGVDKYPVVAHRKSRRDWVVVMNLNDWLILVDKSKNKQCKCACETKK